MTMPELLEDTIAYYSVNPNERRCAVKIDGKLTCKYSPITLKKIGSDGCAIGRHLDKELAIEIDEYYGGNGNGSDITRVKEDFNDRLPIWMQEMSTDFLERLQLLHDRDDYWNESGLTPSGQDYIDLLKLKYGRIFYRSN